MARTKVNLPKITVDEIVGAVQSLNLIKRKGLKSDLTGIDDKVGGVWRDGIVISGKPGFGKTVFALNLAVGFARRENLVVYLDLENDRDDQLKRIALIFLGRERGSFAPNEAQLIEKHEEVLRGPEVVRLFKEKLIPYFALITPTKKITPAYFQALMETANSEVRGEGKQLIFFIDSINELAAIHPLGGGMFESIERWLAEIKLLRVQLQIPIVLLCHVPKDAPPDVFNPKGTSALGHFARTQIIVERPDFHEFHIKIVRAQFGPGGDKQYRFDRARLLLEGYE